MRNVLLGLLTVTSVWFSSSLAHAQTKRPFSITGTTITQEQAKKILETIYSQVEATPQNQNAFAAQWNNNVATFDKTFENQINGLVEDINYGPITSAFANAGALSTKTMPADYATDYDLFTLSFGAGSSVHGVDLTNLGDQNQFTNVQNNQSPDLGIGFNVSLLAGINLNWFNIEPAGWFDPKRMSLYLNVFAADQSISGINSKINTFSFGLHGTYRIVDEVSVAPFGLLHWGGLNVGTGFNINNYTITATHAVDNVNEQQTFDFDGQTLQLSYQWAGDATVTVTNHSVTIPFEASTNVQLLYFLTLYGGVGVDLNFGTASATATSNAPVSLKLRNVNTGKEDNSSIQPVAHFNLDTPGFGPTVGNARAFGGAQINIVVLALFAQAQVDTADDWGVNIGARAFW